MPRKRGRGNRIKGAERRKTVLKAWKTRRKKYGLKQKKTTGLIRVLKHKAEFNGTTYKVYASGSERAIFPRPDKHPEYADAPYDTVFTVRFRGCNVRAVKKLNSSIGLPRIPCLSWKTVKTF